MEAAKEVLEEALRIVQGARLDAYGTPEDSFSGIADLWTAYTGVKFSPEQVAMMMVLLKVAQQSFKPKHDNLVDIAGYVAQAATLVPRNPLTKK